MLGRNNRQPKMKLWDGIGYERSAPETGGGAMMGMG